MSKPYLIINVVEGSVGVIRLRDNYDEAVDVAVEIAKEQVNTPESEIRAEIQSDTNFVSPNGDIEVIIAQWEDD